VKIRNVQPSEPERPPRRWRLLLRPRVWASLIGLFGLGLIAHTMWNHVAPRVTQHPQYHLTPDRIHVTPPPPWIRSDIKAEVLRDAGLEGTISVLDDWPAFSRRIEDAFEFHPWVASVDRINRRLPSALEIELSYRRPIAVVESSDGGSIALLPIDAHANRLPENDLSDVERRYLPRISGITGRPLVGDVWADRRVVDGAKLATGLADVWHQLRLVEIIANPRTPTSSTPDDYAFEIVTSGGTRILWGAPPGAEPSAGESPFDTKRARLLEYAATHGRLETIDGPETLDVRNELIATPRTARRDANVDVSESSAVK
jgi:hypothetical protein